MASIKSDIYHYLGMDLPRRTLPLNFVLPKVTGKFKGSLSKDIDFQRDLDECREVPFEYFKLLIGEIKHINRFTMKPLHRLLLTRQMLRFYYPMALAQIAKLAKGGGVPDMDIRSQMLDMISDIAQIMFVSYQILFAGYYASSNFKYARVRNIVHECASRIFELLVIRQQVRSLRYQLLSDQDWMLANTLFFIMSCYENVEQQIPTLNKGLDVGKRSEASLTEQFGLLQTIAKFDMLRWPSHLQWVIVSYYQSVANAVQVKLIDSHVSSISNAAHSQPRVDDGSYKLGRSDLVAYCYDTGPAHPRLLANPPGPALILAFTGLTDAIRKDCMGFMFAKKNNQLSAMPPRFARFPDTEHFIISEQLVRGLENATDGIVAEKEQRVEDLRIFVGFTEVFDLLQHKLGMYKAEDRLEDMLAKRSALIAEDDVATEKSVWSMLFKNEKMIRLSTQETTYTKPMTIGSLLAYGLGENINRPGFAVVSRIFRPSHKVVEIDIYRIAGYAEPVIMDMNESGQAKSALLVYDLQLLGGWGMMFPPMDIVPGVDKLTIYRNNQKHAVELENMRNATTDFYLFSTSLTSEQLGINGQPDYDTSTAKKTHASAWML